MKKNINNEPGRNDTVNSMKLTRIKRKFVVNLTQVTMKHFKRSNAMPVRFEMGNEGYNLSIANQKS